MVVVRGYGKQRMPRPPVRVEPTLDAARAPTGHGFT
jgi:hypothetical protein